MAFLQRVVNGGGILEREYAIGSDRMDLYLRYGAVRMAIELKVWRDGRPDPLKQGLAQLDEYMSGLGLNEGWLVISTIAKASRRLANAPGLKPFGRGVTVIRA